MPALPDDVDDLDVRERATVTLDGTRGDLLVTADRILFRREQNATFVDVDANAVEAVEHRHRASSPDVIAAAGLVAASALAAYAAVHPPATAFAAFGVLAALATSANAYLLRPKRLRVATASTEYAFGNLGDEKATALANAIRNAGA